MRRLISLAVLSLLSLSAMARVSASQEDLLRTRDAVWRACFSNDQSVLHQLTPPDSVVITAGEPIWRSQASVFQSRTEVQRFGDVAIVHSSYLLEAEVRGKRKLTSGRGTEVFVWRRGKWLNPGWHTDAEPG